MKASLVIPCWNSEATIDRCLACVRAQTLKDFEAIFIDDGSTDGTGGKLASAAAGDSRIRVITQANRGVSAARNAGLDAARGEFVFFADPDDVFSPEMLEKGVAAMEKDDADYCVFPYRAKHENEPDFHLMPIKGGCRYATNDEVIAGHMSRMFGYSAAQVRAWYAGASLHAHRLQGGVCWCVFRRGLIEKNHVRFDERIHLYEDAMFNCEYMLGVGRMTCANEPLYDYILSQHGAVSRLRRGMREMTNKLELLRKRKELDAKSGGRLKPFYACSCVFSLLEMLQITITRRAPFFKSIKLMRDYARDDVVRSALREFPLSWRHPVLAFAVIVLRLMISK